MSTIPITKRGAEKLKEEGRLSLDMLQRFGEELIEAVNHLEAEGVAAFVAKRLPRFEGH